MSVQKQLGNYRAKEVERLNNQIGMLGNFTGLVGALIGAHMMRIGCGEKRRFMQGLVECAEERREPLFEAELGFDAGDGLCMVPGAEVFVARVMDSVRRVEADMIRASRIVDFEGALRDREKYGFDVRARDGVHG